MMFRDTIYRCCVPLLAMAGVLACTTFATADDEQPSEAERIVCALGVAGGLCVQIGAEEVDAAATLAHTGRYLIHILDVDAQAVDRARTTLHAAGVYGLASADRLPGDGKLPYTEDLVNLLYIAPQQATHATLTEVFRVLCPNGVLVVGSDQTTPAQLEAAGFEQVRRLDDDDAYLVAVKPRPVAMDGWSHPRHSASGNAASNDALVAPPRRIRWVAGAESEVRGMVTAGGRNFYAGVLARDSFNGLRLWHRDLVAPDAGRFVMRNLDRLHAAPVAGGERLYVVQRDKLLALDASTGKVDMEYSAAGAPSAVMQDNGILFAVTPDSVRALDIETGSLNWRFDAASPRHVVAGDDTVALMHGLPRRDQPIEAVVVDRNTGRVRWKRSDLAWLPKVTRTVYHDGLVAFEVSSLNDDGPNNALHLLSAATGEVQLDYPFLPGMNHHRQARAMFVDGRLWLLHGGKDANAKRLPIQVSAIDVATGKTLVTHPAGLAHCFPPVMTSRFMLSGEFDLTDLTTGAVDRHQITKAACGPDGGWVPANGLIYVTPKHCVCWPMVRGYTALAPQRPAGGIDALDVAQIDFPLERGVDPPTDVTVDAEADWPMYRHDDWRSGSTTQPLPERLDVIWSVDLGQPPEGILAADWRENCFVKGPIASPVIAGDRVVVARPDSHEVVALSAESGQVAWRFTAGGRVDTPPTLHKGLCLFGDKSGHVYCLRADDGQVVWRLRAAPVDERIVAYGQLESPWPVPGSVLVVDDVAYFAAGRQSLADGGILIFAVDPPTGDIAWVQRLDSVPQKGFYECSGLEFDNFDLLHREGDGVGMSRWVFDRSDGAMSLDRWAAFARLNTGGGSVMAPRGCWSYAPRHQARIPSFTPSRPLVVYRDKALFGHLQGASTVYRRDFDLEGGEKFDTKWITGWAAGGLSRDGHMPWRSHRLAEKASWKVEPFGQAKTAPPIHAMLLCGDKLLLAGGNGQLRVIATDDGRSLAEQTLPEPLWDGLALAQDRIYYATRQGQLLCLGDAQ